MSITMHQFQVSKEDREIIKNQKACTIWMSGLSGSGKSTIANLLEVTLNSKNYHTYILDGDNTRIGLNKDLGFSNEDRIENLRRVSEVCKLMNGAGIIVICSFISPFEENRKLAKSIIGNNFIEFFIDTDISVCESRDPKGLYKKARSGEIKDFTGISSPFEIPENAIRLSNNEEESLQENVNIIIDTMRKINIIE